MNRAFSYNHLSLEQKFQLGFLVILVCLAGILIIEYKLNKIDRKIEKITIEFGSLQKEAFDLEKYLSDFYIFESKDDRYYKDTNRSSAKHIVLQKTAFLNLHLNTLFALFPESESLVRHKSSLQSYIAQLSQNSERVTDLVTFRGYRDFGKIGEMRASIHLVESLIGTKYRSDYLSIRRNEKDFLLRKDLAYAVSVEEKVNALQESFSMAENDSTVINALAQYLQDFQEIVAIDMELGSVEQKGLLDIIRQNLDLLDESIQLLRADIKQFTDIEQNRINALRLVNYAILIFVLLIFGYLFHFRFTQPMQKLSDQIKEIQDGREKQIPDDFSVLKIGNEVSNMAFAIKDLLNKLEDQKEKLANLAIDAQEASRVKSDFLSTMSHEIRTPLNAVINIISELSDSEEIPTSHDEDIQILKSSADYLLALVNDVLDMNKLEEGKVRLQPKECNLHEQLKTIGFIFDHRFVAKNIRFELQTEYENIPQLIWIDGVRLNQVLYNLLGNALKFTHEGEVCFCVSTVQLKSNKSRLKFSIKDTGIGIPKAHHKKIFDRFNQAESSNIRSHSGSGLGLSIAQKLVNMMGAEIQLKSEVGKGSEFYFEIEVEVLNESTKSTPIHANASLNEPSNSSTKDAKEHILVVDDNAVNLRIATKVLEKAGYKISTATNGELGFEAFQQKSFDLVLMDLQMPVMDGFEATRRIRKIDPETPIIAVSASSLVESKDEAYAAGMNGFVTKPFTPVELLSAVKKSLTVLM